MKYKKHAWTKEKIKELVKIWESKTLDEMVIILGIPKQTIWWMAHRIRKLGYPLTQKKKKGYIDLLIKDALGDLKTKKK